MERIVITGATGFIGQALIKRLVNLNRLEKKYHIIALTQEPASIRDVDVVSADLLDYDKIGNFIRNLSPHFVIHLAARTEVEGSFYDPVGFSKVNYVGTVNLLEHLRDEKDLKLFLFSSTMETYGHQEKREPFDEDTPQNPNAPYAVAKLACEKYLEYMGRTSDFPYCTLRQTNTYGRASNDFFVIERIITQMLKDPNEAFLGYRDPYRNFLYIEDLLGLYMRVLSEWEVCRGETFCTGPDNALRIEDLAQMIAEKLDWKGTIRWGTRPKRIGEIYYLNSTHAKAERILGWSPKTSLSDGLDKTIAHWRTQLS